MDQEIKDIELIEAYASGTLGPAETGHFESRRKEDPAFDQEVKDYVKLISEIKVYGEKQFYEQVQSWEKDIQNSSKPAQAKVIYIKWISAIAATVLLLILPLMYMLHQDNNPETNELFIAYFQPYDDVISERSADETALSQGMSAYNQGDYENAAKYLSDYTKSTDEINARLYLGISLLANDNVRKAQSIFEELAVNSSGLNKEVSQWYLALAYLKQQELDQAKDVLSQIKNHNNHIYQQEASQLLSDLD